MTTTLIPDFIVRLFEAEIFKINKRIIEYVCAKYNLNTNEVIEDVKKNMNITLNVIPEHIKITKIRDYGVNTTEEERCIGRVYHKSNNEYVRCIRRGLPGCNKCKTHLNKCVYGTINDPEPEGKEVIKRVIY